MSLQHRIQDLCAGFSGTAGVAARNLTSAESVAVNDAESFPTASMIKIVILFELVRACARGQAQMWERITLRAQDKTIGSGLMADFDEGTSLTLRDLAVMMMGISDNTATNMLIDRLGIGAVNQACREAGMLHTELRGKVDFDRIRESSSNLAVSTPADFVHFLTGLRRGELLALPYVEQMLGIMRIQKYMGQTLRRYLPYDPYALEFGEPQDMWIASKTGGLSGVRTEAGIIHTASAEWVVCVCTKGYTKTEAGSDDPGSRFIAEASRAIFEAWSVAPAER